MSRFETHLDPEARDELDRLDAVLAGDREADPLLAVLADDIVATRPQPDAEARERLEARTAEVRARHAGSRRRTGATSGSRREAWRARLARPTWRVGLAVAATVAVAVPVAGIVLTDRSAEKMSATLDARPMTEELRRVPGAGEAAASAESTRPKLNSRGAASLTADRQVVRDVQQTVRVTPGALSTATAKVTSIVEDAGGYLASSQVLERGAGARGTFEIVVPSAQLDGTIGQLSRVGRLVRLDRSSTDITDQATSVRDRLKDARADRAALRLQLARTVDPGQRAARRRELRVLSSRVARLQREDRSLRQQTSTARIGLRLTTSRGTVAVPVDDGRWGLADAWRDAGRVLEVVAGALLIGAAVVVPIGLLGTAAVAVRRRRRRARDERLVDDA